MASKRLNIRAPPAVVTEIEQFVDEGRYLDRSDFMREALRAQIRREQSWTGVADGE